MKIVDIIIEDKDLPGNDPKVMADWLRTAGATGSEAAKDPNVISAAIRIYSARKELSPDEAFSIAKNQVYKKKKNDTDKEKGPFASASHDYKSAMDQKSKLKRGFNEPSHSHLRKSVGDIEIPDIGAGKNSDSVSTVLSKGKSTGDKLGSKLAKLMRGYRTGKDKPTFGSIK